MDLLDFYFIFLLIKHIAVMLGCIWFASHWYPVIRCTK